VDSSPTSPFCRKWPNDHYFCNGPLLSGEEAYARIEQSGLTNGATLVGIRSSPAAGLTPDGDQSMKDGGVALHFLSCGRLDRADRGASRFCAGIGHVATGR
jgi:hypothetical protein